MKALPAVFADEITADDWHIIKQYHEMLTPIHAATTLLQGHAGGRFVTESLQKRTKRSKAVEDQLQRTLRFNNGDANDASQSQFSQLELT
ncbi:hypothetical protein LTR17_023624 [Elasticomyces elasticus]|nr:hypothetical protein LTR17_023624 [Elasticomyces elasticus]